MPMTKTLIATALLGGVPAVPARVMATAPAMSLTRTPYVISLTSRKAITVTRIESQGSAVVRFEECAIGPGAPSTLFEAFSALNSPHTSCVRLGRRDFPAHDPRVDAKFADALARAVETTARERAIRQSNDRILRAIEDSVKSVGLAAVGTFFVSYPLLRANNSRIPGWLRLSSLSLGAFGVAAGTVMALSGYRQWLYSAPSTIESSWQRDLALDRLIGPHARALTPDEAAIVHGELYEILRVAIASGAEDVWMELFGA